MPQTAAVSVLDSPLAQPPLSIVAAWQTVSPSAGEYAGRGQWLAMTLAGLLRLAGVACGHLCAQAFGTRVRATVTPALLLLAWLLSLAMRHA